MSTRHPRALYLLSVVQLWERFACFATLPLLVLYLQAHRGLRFDEAVGLVGLLQALSYLAGLPGGQLADRWLGPRLATFLGLVLLALGYAALALDRPAWLGPALVLLIAGHGLFKPGFYRLAGLLYRESDPRRDSGFLLMHYVFNAGTAVAPLVAEGARARWGWAAVFQVGTAAMLLAVVSFVLGVSTLRALHRGATDAAITSLPPQKQRERVRACWLICGVGVLFWLTAVQPTTSLTLFAAQHTRLQLVLLGHAVSFAPGHFMTLHALLVLVLAPPLSWILARLQRFDRGISTPGKMACGFVVTSAAFLVMERAGVQGGDEGQVGLLWLSGSYVLLTLGELLLAPMGLALVTRLAPPERASRMVALWCVATAVGNTLAGALGLLWTRWPHHRYFALLAILSLGATAVLLATLRRLEQLLHADGASRSPNHPEVDRDDCRRR
jgi:POT family proton-dependent oligopeptide transporter